jgi:hypothetical protein
MNTIEPGNYPMFEPYFKELPCDDPHMAPDVIAFDRLVVVEHDLGTGTYVDAHLLSSETKETCAISVENWESWIDWESACYEVGRHPEAR